MSTSKPPSNPHHEGKQSLELSDGENWKEIKPSELSIVWGCDNRYWKVPDVGPAELYQVSWLEVTGCLSKTDPGKEYEVGFSISLTADAFGWTGTPVYILVKRGKTGKFKGQKFTLESQKEKEEIKSKVEKLQSTEEKDAVEDSKIYFGLYEVWRGKWKGGLKIHHAFIRQI